MRAPTRSRRRLAPRALTGCAARMHACSRTHPARWEASPVAAAAAGPCDVLDGVMLADRSKRPARPREALPPRSSWPRRRGIANVARQRDSDSCRYLATHAGVEMVAERILPTPRGQLLAARTAAAETRRALRERQDDDHTPERADRRECRRMRDRHRRPLPDRPPLAVDPDHGTAAWRAVDPSLRQAGARRRGPARAVRAADGATGR